MKELALCKTRYEKLQDEIAYLMADKEIISRGRDGCGGEGGSAERLTEIEQQLARTREECRRPEVLIPFIEKSLWIIRSCRLSLARERDYHQKRAGAAQDELEDLIEKQQVELRDLNEWEAYIKKLQREAGLN